LFSQLYQNIIAIDFPGFFCLNVVYGWYLAYISFAIPRNEDARSDRTML